MRKTLVLLGIVGLILLWKFVLFPEKLDFTDKMKVMQGLVMAATYKQAIAEYWQKNKTLPNAEQWISEESKVKVDTGKSIVESIKVAEVVPGSITIYYSNARDQSIDPEINAPTLSLTPKVQSGKLQWSCRATVPARYLPASCR